MLEYLGYTPIVHWLGSDAQFRSILEGKSELEGLVLLSCHGTDEGFYAYENKLLKVADISVNMKDKTVLSLGCVTGKEHFAKAFLNGDAKAYIAPPGYPEGNSSMIFAVTFLWKLQIHGNVTRAWKEASALLKNEDDHFRCYQRSGKKMLADDNEEIPKGGHSSQ